METNLNNNNVKKKSLARVAEGDGAAKGGEEEVDLENGNLGATGVLLHHGLELRAPVEQAEGV